VSLLPHGFVRIGGQCLAAVPKTQPECDAASLDYCKCGWATEKTCETSKDDDRPCFTRCCCTLVYKLRKSQPGSVRLAEPLSSMPGAPGNGDNPDNPAMGANGVGVATTGATTGATTCTSTGCGCSWANSDNCKTSDGTICHKECCCKLAAMATVNFERFRGIANLVKLPDHHTFTGATLVLVDCGLLQEHVRELGSLGDEQGKTGVVFAVVD